MTSVMGTGQLSSWPESGGKDGLAGADAVCQARAAAARLDNPDRFKAWITDGTAAPLERLTSDGPWARVDGVPLAKNRAELGAVPLFTTLDLTEIGSRLANVNLIWTGAGPDPDANCMGWTSSSIYSRGSNGWTWSVTEWSSHRLINSCNVALPIYCFED